MSDTLLKPNTVADMALAYQTAEKKVRTAYALLLEAKDDLCRAFGDGNSRFDTIPSWNCCVRDNEIASRIMDEIKQDAWAVLTERMELRRTLSLKARQELDTQLEHPKDLPAVTEENIWAMWRKVVGDLTKNLSGAVIEVYNWLRPRQDRFKTNSQFRVGRKVVLENIVTNYKGGYHTMNTYCEQNLTALDNVMSMLAGEGTVKTYHGPLYDAVSAFVTGQKWNVRGETLYFYFRVFRCGTLHVEFRRMDLVNKLNQLAGADKLPAGQSAPEPPPKSETLLLTSAT